MLYYILYKSTASADITPEQLQQILLKSQRNNAETGVTGILLFVEGTFIQLLEGPVEPLRHLYNTIASDTRHSQTVVLSEGMLHQRHFPNWSMGLRSLSFYELSKSACFRDLEAETFLKLQIRNSDHPALQELRTFYEPEFIDI